MNKPEFFRFPLMGLSIIALLAALWSGLVRLGWALPAWQPNLALAHGPLMISGFLGTLVALERVVALRRPWMYAAPLFSGLGGLLLLLGVGGRGGVVLLTLGSAGLVAIFAVIVHQHRANFTITMALGSLAWLVGNLLWLFGWPIFRVALWWGAFLALTIAGERLELSRVRRLKPASHRIFALAIAVYLAGMMLSLWMPNEGVRLAGAGMLALAGWLLTQDIARRTVRQTGLPRFVAVCLLSGYAWLGAAGIFNLVYGSVPAGYYYDAMLHALLVGFVLSMIFGHAPIIFPALFNRMATFSPALYLPLALLHASLLLRVGGDLALSMPLRLWGGLVNEVALLLYFILFALTLWRSARQL